MPPSLLDLPVEVRLMIWKQLFSSTTITLTAKPSLSDFEYNVKSDPGNPLAVPHTNRTLYREANPLVLPHVTISSDSSHTFHAFFKRLPRSKRLCIKHIRTTTKLLDLKTFAPNYLIHPEKQCTIGHLIRQWRFLTAPATLELNYEPSPFTEVPPWKRSDVVWKITKRMLRSCVREGTWENLKVVRYSERVAWIGFHIVFKV